MSEKWEHDGQIQLLLNRIAELEKEIELLKKNNEYYEIDYFDFENHFRGSEESIFRKQEIYLKYFIGKKNVLDLGCGRGEFLDTLYANDITSKGCDTYEPFVDYCREKGFEVECKDCLEFIKEQKEVGGIMASQLVEHLNLSQVIELCKIAFEKLQDGAFLVMETPNPRCLSVFANSFYMDPSHRKPVHPLTLQYLTEKAGFKKVEILNTPLSREGTIIPELNIEGAEQFNDSMHQVQELLFGSQDYAIIAQK